MRAEFCTLCLCIMQFAEPNASFITFGGFTILCTNPGTCNVGLVAQFGAMLYIPPNSLVLSGMNYGLYASAFSMVQGQGISFVNSQNYGVAVAENASKQRFVLVLLAYVVVA